MSRLYVIIHRLFYPQKRYALEVYLDRPKPSWRTIWFAESGIAEDKAGELHLMVCEWLKSNQDQPPTNRKEEGHE